MSPTLTSRAPLAATLLLAGCLGPGHLQDPDPALKIPAMKRAAAANDRAQIPRLVDELENDDPAVRLYAIGTLERLTGTRNGYDYYAPEPAREAAVARWRDWLASHPAPPTPAQKKE